MSKMAAGSLAAIWFDARSGIWRSVLAYKVYPKSGLDNKNEEAQRIHRSRKGRYVIPKGGRTRCYMCRASICRCLPRQSQSPALSFAVSPCSPAGVVVRYVVVAARSRGPGKIAVPRERLYRNSDCQISQVILCQAGATASPSVIALHASASLRCLSEAEESVFSPRSIFAPHETKIPGIPARGGAYDRPFIQYRSAYSR